jgi:phosphoribosylamine--glycine ligase
MEKVGVLVVSYGAREVSMVDAFARSQEYNVEIYIADKQRNPFNVKHAAKHAVIPNLSIKEIAKFAETNKDRIDFGIVGPEKPIIDGVRDLVEDRTDIQMICPTKEFAIESSKVQQRLLFEETVPNVNPHFEIFSPEDYKSQGEVKRAVYQWLDELENKAVVKPDRPAAGKGVGVWGDHFTTREQLFEHFLADFQHGAVIIEEKVDGEESSYQAFCDGKHLVPLPETRDYKRAFDDDKGSNTGGMGSYKSKGDILPFMKGEDRNKEIEIVNSVFEKWRRRTDIGLRGIPFYVAFMHTAKEPKVLENNSRPGDPEIINILPILKDDFVDVCFKILESNLTHVNLEKAATVVTYKVPPSYGGYNDTFPDRIHKEDVDTPVDLTKAYELAKLHGNRIRTYPAGMELRAGETYALKSRAVAVVGIGGDIEEARQLSLDGINAVQGGALWHRTDIASRQHIDKSMKHMEELRLQP